MFISVRRSVVALLCATALLSVDGVGTHALAATQPKRYSVSLPVPLRRQFDANFGYCGETSLITAGMMFGQYLSQYDLRALASPGQPQSAQSSQLLVGVNDQAAATRVHLRSKKYGGPTSNPRAFLTWIKEEVTSKHPVVIGVFTNSYRFDDVADPNAGEIEYDHIVTVTGVSSSHPLTQPATYYADDTITFTDHGIWTGTASSASQYVFTYPFATFAKTRQQANAKTGSVYSLPSGVANFGLAITGVADDRREALPLLVSTSVNSEGQMRDGSNVRPPASKLTVTATISGLKANTKYKLYRYNSAALVPNAAFNANAARAASVRTFLATGSTYVVTEAIRSSDQVFYRAVPTSSP